MVINNTFRWVLKYTSVGLCILFFGCATNTLKITTKTNFEVIDLPDGSQIYLNHDSNITYDKDFDSRTIALEGEAFFKVVANEIPFLVTTEFGEIKVLGTEFNVKTATNQIEVDVRKGLVELKTEYDHSKVKKGMKAIYTDGEKAIRKIRSSQKFKKWIKSLKTEFLKLGKEIKPVIKSVGKEFKKMGKEVGKEFKKLNE
jgi:hypothetical protein